MEMTDFFYFISTFMVWTVGDVDTIMRKIIVKAFSCIFRPFSRYQMSCRKLCSQSAIELAFHFQPPEMFSNPSFHTFSFSIKPSSKHTISVILSKVGKYSRVLGFHKWISYLNLLASCRWFIIFKWGSDVHPVVASPLFYLFVSRKCSCHGHTIK